MIQGVGRDAGHIAAHIASRAKDDERPERLPLAA
jgi:hypothetical protein